MYPYCTEQAEALAEHCFSPYQFLFPANWAQTTPTLQHFFKAPTPAFRTLLDDYAKVLMDSAFDLRLPALICIDVAGEFKHVIELHSVKLVPAKVGPEVAVFEFAGKVATLEGVVEEDADVVHVPLTYSRISQFSEEHGWQPAVRLPSTRESRTAREKARMALLALGEQAH